jgi:hypothetical protein
MISSAVVTSIVAERFLRVHSDGNRPVVVFTLFLPMLDPPLVVEPGGQRCFELGKPPVEPLLALATPGSRRPNESHTTSVGSRNESDHPGAWTEPRQAPVLGQWNKQPPSARPAMPTSGCGGS